MEAFEVFDAMFKIEPGKKPGKFSVNQVIRAMEEAGFVVEKLVQGRWDFRRAGERPSGVHLAHGSHWEIGQLRKFATRLSRVYGYDSTTFTLK